MSLPANHELDPSWALVTIAALAKQIGRLEERFDKDSDEGREVQAIEEALYARLFDSMDHDGPSLAELGARLDALQ